MTEQHEPAASAAPDSTGYDPDDVLAALRIDHNSTSRDRTVDITTYGARTGRPRRIETWFHHLHGRWYLSGSPGRRDWYANLRANPSFVFHLKGGVVADLGATGVPITDAAAKRSIVEAIFDDHGHRRGLDAETRAARVEAWVRGSPVVEIVFDDPAIRG